MKTALRTTRFVPTRAMLVVLALPVVVCLGLLVWLLLPREQEHILAAYASGLRDRTRSQIHNVKLAVAALDGYVLPPGKTFSFNKLVGPWGADRGYVRAPVSFSGERVLDWGGGVCQASTVLYNAALHAGLPILERHRHYWPTTYVAPGQDAAVAYPNIDLRFMNTLSAPIRIHARIEGEAVVITLTSRAAPPNVRVERTVLSLSPPALINRPRGAGRSKPTRGFPGYDVAVYRVFSGATERRELISRDSYPAQSQVVYQ